MGEARSQYLLSVGRVDSASADMLGVSRPRSNSDEGEYTQFFRGEAEEEEMEVSTVIKDIFHRKTSLTSEFEQPKLSVHRVMDKAPFLLLEDMPAARFYPMFVHGCCQTACVISHGGDFIGLVTRESLIASSRDGPTL